MYPYKLDRNPYPSSPTPTLIDARILGGKRHRKAKAALMRATKAGVAGKRHRLISHNAKYIRQNRGTEVLADADTARVKLWAPYGLK